MSTTTKRKPRKHRGPTEKRAPKRGGGSPAQRKRQAVRTARAIDLTKQAVELRRDGHSIRAIADKLGVASSTVHEAIQRGLADTVEATKVPAEQLRAQETERLEHVLLKVTPLLDSPDPMIAMKAAGEVRQTSQRLSSLHGLDAPSRIEAKVEVKNPRDEMDRLLGDIASKLAGGTAPAA